LRKVYIGSKNPVKIACAEQAFQKVFPKESFEFEGTDVDSDISHQPMTDQETRKGAKNRVQNTKNLYPDGDFWVGIEGGIQQIKEELHAFAWMVVISRTKTGVARTATFLLPPEIAKLVKQGVELGEADDIVFRRENSKQKDGAVGILTDGLIDRTQYYEHAMILALIPFMKENLFPES